MDIKFDTSTLTAILDTAEKLTVKAERFADAYQTVAEATENVVAEVADAIERVAVKPTTNNNTNVTQNFAGGATATEPDQTEAKKRTIVGAAVTKREVVTFSYPESPEGTLAASRFSTRTRRVVPTRLNSETFTGLDLDVDAQGEQPVRQFRFDKIVGPLKVTG